MSNQFNPQEVARNIKTLPPSCQKLTTGMQQRWNRAIPESDYIQLGTLRYGVRLSNPNLANAASNDDNGNSLAKAKGTQQSRISSDSYDQHTNGSSILSAGGTISNSSRASNESCCCIGTNGIEAPWNSGYVRTRLPVPSSLAKNRKSSPSTSTSSSSSSTTHRQLHQAPQKQTATQQGSREKLQQSTTDLLNNCSNKNTNGSTFAGVDKHNQQRESSPASVSGVCCYTSNNFSSASNKNAKNNNLVKVSNKYSDSKKLKIVNNKGEHKDTVLSSSYAEENRTSRNHRNGFGYGSDSRNLSEKWSSGISGEYDAVNSSAQKHGDFSSTEIISAKEPLSRGGSEVSVKKNDGDDLNLNFTNAQPQSKEPRLKDVNINNFKKRNTSTYGVYFAPNSSVGRTGINNKNNIGKNTTTRGDEICTDDLSSSSSLSPRSPPSPLPLPPPPTVVAESWLFNDRVKQTPPCSPILSCSGSFNKPSSPFETTTTRTESSPFDFSPPGTPQHTRVRAFSDSNGCSVENNQRRINRSAVQHQNKLSPKNHTIPTTENERAYDQRKSSLPVINHASVVRSQPYRKFSSDIISPESNGPPSPVVICQLTPKLSSRGSNAEVRLQSLSRYCAQNLNSNPINDSPVANELEEFTFIDSSDISSTGDDAITVINEEDYREYHKYLSIPKLDGSSDGLCPSGYDSSQNSNHYGYGCSSDELSSVCSGSDSVPTLVVNNFKEEAKRNFHTVKYKQCNVTPNLQSSACAIEENHPSNFPGSSSPVDNEQKNASSVSAQSDSNNNQHLRNTNDEQKLNPSNSRHEKKDDRSSGIAAKTTCTDQHFSKQSGFNNISPDNSSSSLNCFGKHQLHVRSSPEKPIMEKRNNTLDRLQKLVKKTTSGSSESKTSDKQGGTKTERLRELTELLKGTRAPPVPPPRRPKASQSLDKTFERQNTSSLSTASLLNIDSLRADNSTSNLVKSKESRSIDFPYQFVESNRASTPSSPLSEHKTNLRANVSTSNLESLQSSATKETNAIAETPSTTFKEDDDIFTKLSRPESRTIVGSYTQKTIPFRSASFSQVDYSSGKYIRSALGAIKNSLMRGKEGSAVDNVTLPRNKKEFTRSCSPARFSSPLEPGVSLEENGTSKATLKKTELNINLSPPESFERIEGFDGKELSSNRNSDIETIVEDPEAEHSETFENENSIQKKAEINAVQASEMILEPLVEEGIPITPQSLAKDEECLQQATTCLIPVPVYDCVVSEWSTARPSEQWIDASMTECIKLTDCMDNEVESGENTSELNEVHLNPVEAIVVDSPPEIIELEVPKLGKVDENEEEIVKPVLNDSINLNKFENEDMCTPPVSIICTEPDSDISTTIIETPPTPEESSIKVESIDGEIVEVRKRHSNNEDSGEAVSNCNSEMEEKRRIDKSKRRKGIYIQWPAIDTNLDPESDSNDNCTPDDSWRPSRLAIEKDSSIDLSGESCTDLSSKDITSSPEKIRDSSILHGPDPFLLGPNTPDSDIVRPEWPRGSRRKSLTYQSSDEKDDSAPMSSIPVRSFKNIFLRSDSVSDNESERASSRDRTSASPAPSSDHDLRRYSKRPLRGPYGQMLEAEMKKPSKVHYNEILEELARHESSHSFPSACRNRGSGSQSMDETNDRHSSKLFKPRKASANLPLPSHSRTASSPSKLADLGVENTPNSKRHLGNIDQRSTDSDKSEKSPSKLENKKFSLDSHLSDKGTHHHEKHSKRSSGNCEKHQKRSLDDTRYSQASRTPSERSFAIGTPDKPKSLVASPELLAELLKGSSEKLITEQLTGGASPNNASNALPTAVLKCLDTRTHVVVELFNTEKSYVESLQTIVLKYLNQLKSPENAGLVDTQTVDEIFFMVPAILNIHERFLEELRRRLDSWDPMQKIGDAFVDVFSRPVILDTYTSFVNNWNRAKDAIRTTRQKCPAFARFLEAMAREHKGKLSLDNLLIKPVQKFPNYELILSRLIKHTDVDHPDQKPLQEALKLVHDILMFLNCKEKEALENGQRETALRELEGVIEGMNDLVTPDRAFLLFDLVSMPSGQATRKERGFFLFNDLLVITSIKRRSGTIRKTNMTCPGSVASTLDTNKYKFLTKISLDDLEIVKSKDENIRRIMKEIEHLSDDSNKLTQIFDLAASLRCPHQLLEESIRDLQREVQRQLSERQTNDAQLNILELMLNSSGGIQNMTVLFSKPDKRAQWEETFTEAKQKLASAMERCQIPEFVVSVPIRKTRAGLQFTCASPTLGIQRDVWVCNSDGYVGQVCVLSLVPEPTVTSCNGVCNARILCVASVPASNDSSSSHANASINISIQEPPASVTNTINSIVNSKPREKRRPTDGSSTESRNSCNIQLDSDSSSEDSETESQPERAVSPSSLSAVANVSTSLPIAHRHQESNSEETDALQSTMWLGTEDGCIHVYNCTDNIRIKKNKIKIPHISAVYSILYLSNKVFVSLANGDVCIYSRDHNGWNTTTPFTVSVGTVTSPVTKLLNVHGKLWCAIQGCIKVLNTTTLQVDSQIQISNDSKPITNMTVLDEYVWISVQNSAHIKCCHHESYEVIFEVNLAPSVNKMLSNCDDIIRQHKAACLRVTSLLACKDLIWVGTSAGVLLTIAGSNITKGSTPPVVTGIPHGHTGHVRFLTFVESPVCGSTDDLPKLSDSKTDIVKTNTNRTLLVISGGDGYEDFRSSGNNTMSEIAGREDSTNHLLLWHV